jgi:hypothetical protein
MSGIWPLCTICAIWLSTSFQLMIWTSTLICGYCALKSLTMPSQNFWPLFAAVGPLP